MKRKKLSYDTWTCILEKSFRYELFYHTMIYGYISLINMKDVTAPQVWQVNDKDIIVCDNGYKWLCIMPSKENYCITTMINEGDEIILWYIDMIASKGLGEDGVPYFDDLYLDLVVCPDGYIFEDDLDELEEALHLGNITPEQFDLAHNTCNNLKEGLLTDIEALKSYTHQCLRLILANKS